MTPTTNPCLGCERRAPAGQFYCLDCTQQMQAVQTSLDMAALAEKRVAYEAWLDNPSDRSFVPPQEYADALEEEVERMSDRYLACIAARDAAQEALAELVRLKDLHDTIEAREAAGARGLTLAIDKMSYAHCKPKAWAAARAIVAAMRAASEAS